MTNTKKIILTTIAMILTGLIISSVPQAFAEQIKISIPKGSSVAGCETTQLCYIPSEVKVHPRDEVIWSNNDSAAHTVTSGTPSMPDDKFDSGLLAAGKTFSNTFNTLGNYQYFCMVHPWMVGSVLVAVGGGIEVPMGTITVGPGSDKATTVVGLSSDGKIRVEITASNPVAGSTMSIETTFRDSNGGTLKQNTNYDIIAMQNGKQVLSDLGSYAKTGNQMHITSTLASDESVDIKVTLLGFGLGTESQWSGPKGEILMFNVVPEFGTITILILGIAIVSTVIVTTKSKLIPKL